MRALPPPSRLRLSDGRTLAYDDLGDRTGPIVVYLHGTPDSRLARHPDDTVTQSTGVRLLAVDRPGAGDSDLAAPGAGLTDLGGDLRELLDHVSADRVLLLGWSAGALAALAAATVLEDRVAAVGLVGPVPPVEAYRDEALVAALGPGRRTFVEMAQELEPAELAEEIAPYLVPRPLDPELALAHVLDSAGEQGRAELADVPGAAEQLALALQASVTHGLAGVRDDLARQLEPGLDLSAVACPVRCFHGGADQMSPPEVGAWLVAHLSTGVLDLTPKGGHHLLFPAWRGILRALRRDGGL